MSWIDGLDGNHFLRSLFPDGDPPLDAVRVHEIQLHQDGPSLALRFDLSVYPEQPPAKWRAAGSNTVQLRLVADGVTDLVIRGWSLNNVGRLSIHGRPGLLEFETGTCNVTAKAEHLRVDTVTAHRNDERAVE